jgi:hypothetical protein
VVPLAIATVLTALLGGGITYLGGQSREVSDLERQLGTRLTLVSASRVGAKMQDLYIDAGPSWETVAPDERSTELSNIAKGAKSLGIENVFLYSQGQPVGEVHGEAVCLGDCVTRATTAPAAGGATATLKVGGQ